MQLRILKQNYPLLLISILFLAACHKEKPQKSKTELITAGTWKFDQAGLDLNNDGTIDTTLRPDLLPVCYTDNLLTFYADSTGVLDDNTNRCYPSGLQKTPYTWYFLKDETELFMTARILPLYEETSKIIALTDKKLIISRQVGVHGFPSYLIYVVVYVH